MFSFLLKDLISDFILDKVVYFIVDKVGKEIFRPLDRPEGNGRVDDRYGRGWEGRAR